MTTFRPMDITTDAAEMARLYSYAAPEPITAQTACDWWTPREGETRVTMLALDESGHPIGYWDVERETWMNPGRFYIKVIVAPGARGRGLGAQMYADALRFSRQSGATHLESMVREEDDRSVRFAKQRGFQVERHMFESSLELADFDERPYRDLLSRLEVQGFRFFSLADAGPTDENRHRLYDVNRSASLDDPCSTGTFPDFYAFSKNVFEASWFRADPGRTAGWDSRRSASIRPTGMPITPSPESCANIAGAGSPRH